MLTSSGRSLRFARVVRVRGLSLALLLLLLSCAAACGAPTRRDAGQGAPAAVDASTPTGAPPAAPAAPADAPTPARAAPSTPAEPSVRPGANERFLDPELDVAQMVETFEGESREIAASRDALVAALSLRPGQAVADVGAGTGLFLQPFARAVGERGRVVAVEISPAFVAHLQQRVAREGLTNADVHLGGEHDVRLPPASLDVAFVCDTYHHFEYPRTMLASLHSALAPGGLLAIVDFERVPGTSREWVLEHVRAGKETVRTEIEAAGFLFEAEPDVVGLEENYLLLFRRK